MNNQYPLPDRVCAYGTAEEFARCRIESGQWVFWEDRVELVLAGRYHEVKPIHVELSPTYLCNFSCPWCSCRAAREDWSDEDVFNHPRATKSTVMDQARIERVLQHLVEYRIGIMWVGGEPTMNPLLYPVALEANARGLKQCLFTNGSLLNTARLATLFDAELAFIRVSLDAVTRDIHELHHGYQPSRGYAERVLDNLRALCLIRRERNARTQIGVSIVVDERNLADVLPTARYLRSLCNEYGHGAIDYVICRPTYQFYTAQVQLLGGTSAGLRRLVAAGAEVREILEPAGVRVVAPSDSFTTTEQTAPPEAGESCLSCGWFGEITPAADLVICSDRYGNPDYFIGNVAEHNLDQLWSGERRSEVLQYAEQTSCFRTRCPRNGRGFFLNRLFHQIEQFRREQRMEEVRSWVHNLRRVLPRPEHSFFL